MKPDETSSESSRVNSEPAARIRAKELDISFGQGSRSGLLITFLLILLGLLARFFL